MYRGLNESPADVVNPQVKIAFCQKRAGLRMSKALGYAVLLVAMRPLKDSLCSLAELNLSTQSPNLHSFAFLLNSPKPWHAKHVYNCL